MDRETFIEEAIAMYGDKFDYSELPSKIERVKESITCAIHGKIKVIPRDHLRTKYGCPKCASDAVRVSPHEHNLNYIEKAKSKYKGKFDYSKVDISTRIGKKVTIVCPDHGEFRMKLNHHYHSKHGCPSCGKDSGNAIRTRYNTVEDLKPLQRKYFKGKLKFIDFDKTSAMVTVECPNHGRFKKSLKLISMGRGCRRCGYLGRTITPNQFLDRVKEVHDDDYLYCVGELTTVNDKITIRHKCGYIYTGRVSNHLSGQGCRRCRRSLGEERIAAYLTFNQVPYDDQYMVPGYPYRFDFYIEEANLLIEYDGPQHFRPVDYFGGKKGFRETKRRDKIKNQLAKKYGFRLLRIPYREFDNIENTLSRAIDNIFKYRVNNKFYASFLDLCTGLGLPPTTTVRDVVDYRTINVLSPPVQK